MKHLVLVVSLLLLVLPAVAHAQTPAAIPGLQVIAERQYASDTTGPIDASGEGVFLASARVYLFDDAANAESTWETLVAADTVQQDLPLDDESITYEQTELKNVGDRAMVLNLSAELEEGSTGVFRTVIIQRDTMIVTVTVIAGSDEAAEIADDIAIAMSERDPGGDEAVYDGLGGSSGGVWDVFLPADADELAGLQAYADKETRAAQD